MAHVQNAQARLDKAILARMDVIARRRNLDEMVITHLGNRYTQDGVEVECAQLDELDDLYCDNVHEGGFEACWTSEKGWH
ncbi:MAG: hypothetical protein ACYSW8_30800 [Planctomycetota bacterium]